MKPKEILDELKKISDNQSSEFTCIVGKNGFYSKKTFNKESLNTDELQKFLNFQSNERFDNNKGIDADGNNRSN